MGKAIICHTLTMITVIIVLYLCMVTTCMHICTEMSKTKDSPQYMCIKSLVLYGQTLFSAGGLSLAV